MGLGGCTDPRVLVLCVARAAVGAVGGVEQLGQRGRGGLRCHDGRALQQHHQHHHQQHPAATRTVARQTINALDVSARVRNTATLSRLCVTKPQQVRQAADIHAACQEYTHPFRRPRAKERAAMVRLDSDTIPTIPRNPPRLRDHDNDHGYESTRIQLIFT